MAGGRRHLVRTLALVAGLACLAAVPPALLQRLPSVCLFRPLFGFCPGCGSLRALSSMFHGDIVSAVRHNPNCLITGPLLVGLLVISVVRALRRSAG